MQKVSKKKNLSSSESSVISESKNSTSKKNLIDLTSSEEDFEDSEGESNYGEPSKIGYDSLVGKKLVPTEKEIEDTLIKPSQKDRLVIYRLLKIMKRCEMDTEREDNFFKVHNRLQENSDSETEFLETTNNDPSESRNSIVSHVKNAKMNSKVPHSITPNKKGRYGMLITPVKLPTQLGGKKTDAKPRLGPKKSNFSMGTEGYGHNLKRDEDQRQGFLANIPGFTAEKEKDVRQILIEFFIKQDEDITGYLTEEELLVELESTSNQKMIYTAEGSLYHKNQTDRRDPISDVHSLAEEKKNDLTTKNSRKNYKRMNYMNASIEF